MKMTSSVVEMYPNGDKYEGQVGVDGTKHGWGKYTFANGKVYEGNWASGKMNGWGEFVESDTKDRFVGEWEDANRRFGIYFYANGDMYQGGFDESMKHGRSIIWENRVMYEATYCRDKLISKVPWKVRMAESPRRGQKYSPMRGNVEVHATSPEAQLMIRDLEDKVEMQDTQLAVLAKEIKMLKAENEALHSGTSPSSFRSRSRPASRATTPKPARARSGSRPRGPSEKLGMPPYFAPSRTASAAVYKKKRPPSTFDATNPTRLREEFRYYYNQSDR
ncbi:hypothetical protein DIPPA_63174 [Diplonema papillatum]|nr:hypothetical protein DIPPA_63174 [Diplonema papillatum]